MSSRKEDCILIERQVPPHYAYLGWKFECQEYENEALKQHICLNSDKLDPVWDQFLNQAHQNKWYSGFQSKTPFTKMDFIVEWAWNCNLIEEQPPDSSTTTSYPLHRESPAGRDAGNAHKRCFLVKNRAFYPHNESFHVYHCIPYGHDFGLQEEMDTFLKVLHHHFQSLSLVSYDVVLTDFFVGLRILPHNQPHSSKKQTFQMPLFFMEWLSLDASTCELYFQENFSDNQVYRLKKTEKEKEMAAE